MAIDPSTKYSGQVAADAAFPYGKARNESSSGARDGTPLEADLVNDIWGFQQALLDQAGATPTGTPDEVGASQYLDAINTIISNNNRDLRRQNFQSFELGEALKAVTYGDGGFVYVGDNGFIATSLNGKFFSKRTPAAMFAGTFRCVTFGNGLYVAAGSSAEIQTSSDGITWTQQSADGGFVSSFFGATYDSNTGLYILVGENGEIQTSSDGVTWAQQSLAAPAYAGDFKAVTSSGSLIVAVGTSGEIRTSTDGVTWIKRTPGASYSNDFEGVAHGDGVFVAVGWDTEIQTSSDGTTWSAQTPAGGYTGVFFDVVFFDEEFAACGTDCEIQFSRATSGVTWASHQGSADFLSTLGYTSFSGISGGNGVFVCAGTDRACTSMEI